MSNFEEQLRVTALYQYPEHSIAYDYLASFTYPWEALDGLSDFIYKIGETLSPEEYDSPSPGIWIAKSATVAANATISAPLIVCPNAQVRQCAFIRGSAIVGENAVVGNSTELKNCILFDNVQVPHFNYIGDAILGYKAHMGAGAVTSNIKSDRTNVAIRFGEVSLATGRRKCGAMLGDFVEVGCNSVLNPGTVIGAHSTVYPLSSVRGFVPEGHIFKSATQVIVKREL